MMKQFYSFVTCLALMLTLSAGSVQAQSVVLSRSDDAITFVVDEGLPLPESHLHLMDAEDMVNLLLNKAHVPDENRRVLDYSFKGEELAYMKEDVLFQCMVRAYAEHRPLVLSPDIVWLAVSQGFANYVNAHAEELRPQIVDHDGRMTLTVQSPTDLLSGEADWQGLMDGFAAQIGHYTKGDLARTIASDFSTSGPAERIASRITLMDAVKSFFEYEVIYIACGIPQITLRGSVADWQAVLDKARRLKQYGLTSWIDKLEPVLRQFVETAKGRPDRRFWRSIVKRYSVKELRGGACSPDKITMLDGWFLTLFPDKDGKVLKKVVHNASMEDEMVQVDFKYLQIDPLSGAVIGETPMQLMAGFIGVAEDTATYALTPRIGWLVRVGNAEQDAADKLKEENERGSIELRVKEVPEVLRQLPHIATLTLTFTDRVELPQWMDAIQIDQLYVFGNMTDEEKSQLRRRFPQVKFSYLE